MKEYYSRDDVLSFLYDECQMRNVDIAFRRKRWSIKPTSKAQLRNLCKDYDFEESILLGDAIERLVPRLLILISENRLETHKMWVLRELRRNDAIPLIAIKEIADSLEINSIKISKNRMPEPEREFITGVIRDALGDMTLEQKARILNAFWRNYAKRLSEPSGKLMMYLKDHFPSLTKTIESWMEDKTARSLAANQKLIEDKSIDELIGMLGENWRIRTAAAHALAEKCQTEEDIERVISAFQHRKTKARMGAVTAIGLMMSRHERARKAIVEALDAHGRTAKGHRFPRWDVRRIALKIYIHSKPPNAIDILFNAIDNWRSTTCRHDAVALLRLYINNERVVNKLRSLVADDRFPLRARLKAQRLLQRVPD
jgi:hypothetical protein